MTDQIFTDQDVELDLEIEEMVDDVRGIVRLNQSRVQELLDVYGDENPQFPVLRVRAGETSGNGNNWPDSILTSVAEQINTNEKPGFFGHIRPADRGYVFPDPQTIWLGAVVKQEKGKPTLYVKGYNIPGTQAQKHVRSGLVKTASWMGKASGKVVNGVRMIERFALESIDWARPGAAGMDARVVAIATEMEGGDKEMDWSKVTLEELEREAPALFTLMRNKVEGEQSKVVSEMEAKVTEHEAHVTLFAKLREVLGIDDKTDVLEAVTEVVEKVDNMSAKTLKDKIGDILTSKVKNEKARSTILRLVDVSEMEGLSDDDLKTKVEGLFDSDEDIKAVVSEMSSGPAPLASGRHRGSGGNVSDSTHTRQSVKKL